MKTLLRLGIRDLLWATALFGILLAWMLHCHELKHQRDALLAERDLLRKGNEFLSQHFYQLPGHPWNLDATVAAGSASLDASAKSDDVTRAGLIGDWAIERFEIANERGVVAVAQAGTVKVSDATLEVSYKQKGRLVQCPFDYSLDEANATIDLTAGEWDGAIPGAGPNRYHGRFKLDGQVLRLSFGRFHRPDSFTPKQLKQASEERLATPSADNAWFLTLRRSE